MKLYGEDLVKSIKDERKRIIKNMEERNERIANWETDEDDCFVSSRSDQQSLHNCEMRLEILNTDGLMDFEGVFDENGEEIWVKWVHTRYGGAFVGRGVFASSIKALLKKTGWHTEMIKVPVWTKFVSGPGGGLCGTYTGSYELVRWHTNMVTGEYVGYPN